jgi:hypothetical protein
VVTRVPVLLISLSEIVMALFAAKPVPLMGMEAVSASTEAVGTVNVGPTLTAK